MKLSFQIQGFFLYPDMKEFFSSENLHSLFPLVPAGCFFASGGQLIQLDRSRSQTCTMIFFSCPCGTFFASGDQLIQLDRSRSQTCTMIFFSCLCGTFFCLRRPAYSAGPKQVSDLHHDFFSCPCRPFFCLRRPAYSAGPKQVTDLHHNTTSRRQPRLDDEDAVYKEKSPDVPCRHLRSIQCPSRVCRSV